MHFDGHHAVRQQEDRSHAAEVDPFSEVEADPALQAVGQLCEQGRRDHGRPGQLPGVLVEIAVLCGSLPPVHASREELTDLCGVVASVGGSVFALDLGHEQPAVVVVDPQARVGLQPLALVVRIRAVRQLPDHDVVPVVLGKTVQDSLGVELLLIAGLVLRVIAGGRDAGKQRLPALSEGVKADVVDRRGRVRVVFVYDEEGRGAGVFVFGVLTEGPHIAAQLPVPDRVRPGDDQLRGDLRRCVCDRLGVTEDAHRLAAVDSCALHLRLALVLSELRLIWWIDRIAAHRIEALPGLFGAFEVPSGALLIGPVEAPGAGVLMHPAIDAAEIELLPVLQRDRLARLWASRLDAQGEPPEDPVGPRRVEDIGEIGIPDPLQVIQVPLAGLDLVGTAHVVQPSSCDLLGVHRDRVGQDLVPARHQYRILASPLCSRSSPRALLHSCVSP